MRPVTVDVEGAGNSVPIPCDVYISPFHLSLFIEIVSGAIDATVQYTGDDVWDPAVTPNWTPHPDLTNIVARDDATIISPVRAVRLVNANTGTARLIVAQAGVQ